jgi:hypothetical protein
MTNIEYIYTLSPSFGLIYEGAIGHWSLGNPLVPLRVSLPDIAQIIWLADSLPKGQNLFLILID